MGLKLYLKWGSLVVKLQYVSWGERPALASAASLNQLSWLSRNSCPLKHRPHWPLLSLKWPFIVTEEKMIQQLDGKACIFPQISHKRCKMVWKHLILNQIASGSVNTLRQNKHKFTVETFGVIISAFRGILWLQCIPDSCTTMQCLNPAEDLCCVIFPSMLPCLMKGGKKTHKII